MDNSNNVIIFAAGLLNSAAMGYACTLDRSDRVIGTEYNTDANISPLSWKRLHIGNRWLNHAGLSLYDNTARMYDPLTVRFHTPDPLDYLAPSKSAYTHCSGNPTNRTDPTGLTDVIDELGNHYYMNDGIDQVYEISSDEYEERAPNKNNELLVLFYVLDHGKIRNDVFYTVTNVLEGKKFIGWRYNGITNCLQLAKIQNKTRVDDSSHRIDVNEDTFEEAVEYIKDELSKGNSIVVGVDNGDYTHDNNNYLTGHFITIVGMGYECGSNYLMYYDNATNNSYKGANTTDNRLYNVIGRSYQFIDATISMKNVDRYILTEIRRNMK